MDLQSLLGIYRNDPRIKRIAESLRQIENLSSFFLKGQAGSVNAFLAAAVYLENPSNYLFVFPEKEEAAYFHNNIQNLLGNKEVLFLPDSYKRAGINWEINKHQLQQRTEVLNRVTNQLTTGEMVVTYSEALLEKAVRKTELNQNTIFIKIGETITPDHILELLIGCGFDRVDFVYEPGQFSIRGGIIDIFSFGNNHPYRIELFGNEVESIRTFDASSQLSTRKISQITIIPNSSEYFTVEQKDSLLNLFPRNTTVYIKDAQLCFDLMKKTEDGLRDLRHETRDEISNNFSSPDEILKSIQSFRVIEEGREPYFSQHSTFNSQLPSPISRLISYVFDIVPQPPFHKKFDLLIAKMKELEKDGYLIFIFSDNARQIERFHHIFDDLHAEVKFYPAYHSIHAGFLDRDLKIACFTDHEIFERYHKYKVDKTKEANRSLILKTLRELQPGDFVTHSDHGVGVYSGLQKIEVQGVVQEAVRIVYRDNDLLYVNINSLHKISKYTGKEGTAPKINKLGSDAWEKLKTRTKNKVKDIARELILLYAKRKSQTGFEFLPDNYLQEELEASFIYEDTPDQLKATQDVKRDMEQPHPMDRLICGDVGFGKTEIAVRAAFKAVVNGKQVAILVPTTILAIQHAKTFGDRLKDFGTRIEFINRFKSAREQTEIFKELKEGKVDILIGTHALLSKRSQFKDLGLLVVDEEQKFGVGAKEKLRQLKSNVDTLTLTATPIPRTLQFSLMKARDLSIINTPPSNRQPITTEVHVFDEKIIREAIYYEVYRGGQVFFVHNKVKDIENITALIRQLCPDIDIGVAHGQMEGHHLEQAMLKFINRENDVLVCTNIVESGLDIPNANTIIINNANHFGLSDLHQLRGRVGRSNKKAFCYLFSPPLHALSTDARKRLQTIEQFSDLGSGFNIAMRDLDIRGAGNLLGGEQSGFITEIGFEMYHKILDEAMHELQHGEFKDVFAEEIIREEKFVRDCQVDTDLEILIPDSYITNINERLSLYTELSNIENEGTLSSFREKLIDRFGEIPPATHELFNAIRLQWTAKSLGFEKIIFRNRQLKCYFVSNQQSPYYQSQVFGNIMQYVQKHPRDCRMKQTNLFLILSFDSVKNMEQANELLRQINIEALVN